VDYDLLDARTARRAMLRGAAGLAAGVVGASLAGLGTSVAGAAPATFPIKIDATRLFYRYFIIPGVTSDWVDSRTVQTFNLAPGQYGFQFASGYLADFSFRVTPLGTIDYDPQFNGFLSGRNSSTLSVDGLVVTLDARYLSGSGVLLVAPLTNDDWISYRTCRLLPGRFYSVLQGSGLVANFNFQLGVDGRWAYIAPYDVGAGGFLAGAGTSTLTFLGYPLLVDARAAGGAGLTVQPIWGMPFSPTSVEYACLLPAQQSFALQVRSGIVSQATFSVAQNGKVSIDPGATSLLSLDTFHGLTRLNVIAPL
jgi:hypothetical protein